MANEQGKDSTRRIRILQVEDNTVDAEMVADELREDGLRFEARLVDNEHAFEQALNEYQPEVVLSDLSMPGFSGHRALDILRREHPQTPFIFVSGTIGEEAAVNALKRGATDYVLKNNLVRLATSVRRALREAEEQRYHERTESELVRAQRFESMALLAGGLSHDLRNILQPLLLASTMIEERTDDEKMLKLGRMVQDCAQRGLDMVASMLSFARGSQRVNERVSLGALMEALSMLLQGSVPHGVSLHMEPVDAGLELRGNQTELQQCLLNLCLNAVQAMQGGGKLTLASRVEEVDADRFADEGLPGGRYAVLSIRDTGHGMDEEVRAKLFQPFFTTKTEGTGLGLLSCKRIVTNHGGAIRVESEPGSGTCFELYLPLNGAPGTGQEDAGNLVGHGERVLVVVEEAATMSLLRDALDNYSYQVQATRSGAQALQELDDHGLPDLMVMDADMSLMTGVRTLSSLLERGYEGPVALLANPQAPPDLAGLPESLRIGLVDKPVDAIQMLQQVHELLAGDAAASAG